MYAVTVKVSELLQHTFIEAAGYGEEHIKNVTQNKFPFASPDFPTAFSYYNGNVTVFVLCFLTKF